MDEDLRATLPDGRSLSYASYGDPDGEPVIFHHGWPSSRYQAAFLDPIARQREIRLIAPDRPGVGNSDSRPGRHFSHWPEDLAAFADQLGIDRFKILGISGGGPYTLAACAGLGDRIARAAILCGAPPLAEKANRGHMHWVYRTLASNTRLRRMALPGVVRLGQWMVARGPEHAPMSWMLRSIPEVDREAIFNGGGWAVVSRSFREATRRGAPGMLEDGEVYLSPWDFDPGKIDVPVHFWHGEDDANRPCTVAQELAATVPTAATSWVPGQGHYSLPLHYSGEALDWLKE